MSSIVVLFVCSVFVSINIKSTEGRTLVRVQNEIDQIDLESLFTNEKLLQEQLPCLLGKNEPCNAVGRWLKPRLTKVLLGDCYMCTPKQSDELTKGIKSLRTQNPPLFQQIASEYLSLNSKPAKRSSSK